MKSLHNFGAYYNLSVSLQKKGDDSIKKLLIICLLLIAFVGFSNDFINTAFGIISSKPARVIIATRLALMVWNTLTLSPPVIEIEFPKFSENFEAKGFTMGGLVFVQSGLPPGEKHEVVNHETIHCLQSSFAACFGFPIWYASDLIMNGYSEGFLEKMATQFSFKLEF